MERRTFLKSLPALTMLAGAAAAMDEAPPPDISPIDLPAPEKDGGLSVMAALWERKTIRTISSRPLPPQTLSNLLWAAFGVNRDQMPDGRPGRTAASATNAQEIDLYVALPGGVYLYEAVPHRLAPVAAGDFRASAGQDGVDKAPVNLFFVADPTRFKRKGPAGAGATDAEKSFYNVDTGLIAQNVHLFAASQGLAAWFHTCDQEKTPELFRLRPEQRVLFAQSVGYPE